MKIRLGVIAGVFGAALLTGSAANANTIDFFNYSVGTQVSSGPGVTFSLAGSGPTSGSPTISNAFNLGITGGPGLSNSDTGDYPTANILDIRFSSAQTNISFTYENSGDNGSFYDAFNASSVLVSSGSLPQGFGPYATVDVTGAGITDLQLNNDGNNWIFGVGQLTYNANASVPEPFTLSLFGAGLAGAAAMRRRRKKA